MSYRQTKIEDLVESPRRDSRILEAALTRLEEEFGSDRGGRIYASDKEVNQSISSVERREMVLVHLSWADNPEEIIEDFTAQFQNWAGWTARATAEFFGIRGWEPKLKSFEYALREAGIEHLEEAFDREAFFRAQREEMEGAAGDEDLVSNDQEEMKSETRKALVEAGCPEVDVPVLWHGFGAFNGNDPEELARRAIETWRDGEKYRASCYHYPGEVGRGHLTDLRLRVTPEQGEVKLAGEADLWTMGPEKVPGRRWTGLHASCSEALEANDPERGQSEFVVELHEQNVEFVCGSDPKLAEELNRELEAIRGYRTETLHEESQPVTIGEFV